MEKYIPLSTVVAEIESKIKQYEEAFDNPSFASYDAWLIAKGKYRKLKDILSFLDTLEVKDADLETLLQALPEKINDEKSHQVYEMSVYHYDGQCVVDYVGELEHDSLYNFAGDTFYEAAEKAWNWLHKDSNGGLIMTKEDRK